MKKNVQKTEKTPAPRAVSKEIAVKHCTGPRVYREVLLELTPDWSPWAYQVNGYGKDGKICSSSNYDKEHEADALAQFGIYRDADGKLAA